MSKIEDVLYVNKHVIKRTLESIKENWVLYFSGFIYLVLMVIAYRIIYRAPLGMFSGFISAILSSALISNYLYLLFNVINYNRITAKNFRDGFNYFLGKVYGVFFIFYVFKIFVFFINNSINGNIETLSIILNSTILIFLNPLPETIYLKDYNASDSIRESFKFMEENFLNWCIPNVVIFLVIYMILGRNIEIILKANMIKFNDIYFISTFKALLLQCVFTIGMIYRGHLYKILSSGNMRKRKFMREFGKR